MQTKIEIKNGRIVKGTQEAKDIITSSVDGVHILTVEPINPLSTPRNYQKAYFDKLDMAIRCASVGYERYELHEMFKAHSGIETTKNQDLVFWKTTMLKLRWWLYTSFDCIV